MGEIKSSELKRENRNGIFYSQSLDISCSGHSFCLKPGFEKVINVISLCLKDLKNLNYCRLGYLAGFILNLFRKISSGDSLEMS